MRQTDVTAPLRIVLAATFVLAALLVVPAKVAACSCVATTPQEALEFSHAAFVGTVVDAIELEPKAAPPGAGPVAYAFAVEAVAGGGVGVTATVAAGGSDAGCGISFELGQRWLIFANADGGRLTTGLCSGNVRLAAGEPAPLANLVPVAPSPTTEPASPSEPAIGPPLVVGAAGVLLAIVVAWAFLRRPGRPPSV